MSVEQTERVDSHVHLWDRARFDYAWLDAEPATLRASFLPGDLPPDITRLVFVQADCRDDQALDEARWAHELGSPVAAVVAQAPLERESGDHLAALAALPRVAGVRRLLQSEAAGFALQDEFIAGVRSLARHGFTMDLCIRSGQLTEATELVRRCPDVQFVLDHLGKPVIRDDAFSDWANGISDLAALPNVACKVSGLLTEAAAAGAPLHTLDAWLLHALDTFGADRCMYGSDWPVVTAVGASDVWLSIVEHVLGEGTASERDAVLTGTATRVYRLG